MTSTELQKWLNAHGASLIVDGKCGMMTRAAIAAVFSNKNAPAINDADLLVVASRLGCTTKQIRAVAAVESGGGAYDTEGRPKILFERHLFDRFTDGAHSICAWSNPKGGGYAEDSWQKLENAACADATAAFKATSWGKFQVLGMHSDALGYASPLDMAYSTVTAEAAHYEMLARYLEKNGLVKAIRALSTNAADNVAFAKGYNGAGYLKFDYHNKLARAMR